MTDRVSRVQRLPAFGETLVGRSFHIGYGGRGTNQAVAAAHLGATVAMVTRVLLGREDLTMAAPPLHTGIDTIQPARIWKCS